MKLVHLILPLSLVLGACNKEESGTPGVQARENKGLVEQAKEKGASMLADFQKASQDKLASVDTTIASLKEKASKAAADHKPELDKLVADLTAKKDALMAKLAELKGASSDKLATLTKELEPKIAELVQSAKDALAKLK